jgi:hypothetical protein
MAMRGAKMKRRENRFRCPADVEEIAQAAGGCDRLDFPGEKIVPGTNRGLDAPTVRED